MNAGSKTDKNQGLTAILTAAKSLTPKIATESAKQIPEDMVIETLGLIREQFNLPDNNYALIALCILLQKGGCNANKTTNIVIILENKNIDSKTVNKIIRDTCKNFTPRALARQLGKEIFEIAKLHQIPGNLALKLQRTYPDAWNRITNPEKTYWASDFQVNTDGCPPEMANLIQTNYENNFKKKP
jgi:hypothetical protein